ncbi:class I SAM-dependent methyltransferase [Sphaerisporangium sp. TRM90804]|uniref:class I SAM-dependent methyltransferase n=1 Tax=Sphaerisporangium sp. TRM90804 TaxID=3031113 RepID=UPI00244BDEE5|nr:class I SAM-dependent methyltransferase [Sphaerisporangium sp. TRM90804]MDH2427990.1 class I SAM-dependent methyltransferase [Sphaerisporangium sp. TRM90804]
MSHSTVPAPRPAGPAPRGARATPAEHVEHERAIGDFYSEFPYPWHVTRLARADDPTLHPALVSQELGDFTGGRMPPGARIWVPGCGVNQALIMALRFPSATVVGSDVSEESLRMCGAAAEQVGASNLVLRDEGITQASYREEFDYIACTGVIHHCPNPGTLLERLGAALKPSGVVELMVYNTFHRREITAFQEAMRLIGRDQDLWYAKRLAAAFRTDNLLTRQIQAEVEDPDVQFADTWLNPYEQTYTVADLDGLAGRAGLELEAPCVSAVARSLESFMWEVPVADDRIRRQFHALDDLTRWRVSNLLLMDRSPLVWFYLRRADSPIPATTEAERDERFLDAVMTRVSGTERVWLLERAGGYRPLDRPADLPAGRPAEFQEVVDAVDGRRPVREVLEGLGGVPRPWTVRRMRTMLTTPTFPHLRAV